MDKKTTPPSEELTPYEKTQEMMRRLLAVPKDEATTQYNAHSQKRTARMPAKKNTEKENA